LCHADTPVRRAWQGRKAALTWALLMAFDSFRAFVSKLDEAGELVRINSPVATELEITALADREMKKPGGGKALLFEKATVNGVASQFPLSIYTMRALTRIVL